MTIQAFISIGFPADTPADVDSVVAGITGLPAGATISTNVSQTLPDSSGTIDDGGNIVPHPAPGPTLTELNPQSVVQNGGEVQLHCLGLNFTDSAKIVFGDTELATAFVSATELYATIDVSPTGHAPGTFPVLVRQDGTDTAPLNFTIATP